MGVLFGPKNGQSPALPAVLDGRIVDMAEIRELFGISAWTDLVTQRPGMSPSAPPAVSPDSAMRNSAVWACVRLRADLLSTLPLSVYRREKMPDGSEIAIKVTTPQVLVTPGGERVGIQEWLYSSSVDKDRYGNLIGRITEKDGLGLPKRIDLQLASDVTILTKGGQIAGYRIGGKVYAPADIWHEKQFTVAGLPVGLSPVSYAAMTLGRYVSVEQFAQSWFGGGGVPRARLKNTAKTITQGQTALIKEMWRASIAAGEPFVHGNDWEYDLIQAEQASSDWLEAQKATLPDISRFFGCPADLIDAMIETGTAITYANVTQRNLQFLVMHLRPAIRRSEWALSTLTQAPRFVAFDVNDFLAMDPVTRAAFVKTMIDARTLAPSEAREMEGRPPLTQSQIDEFLTFWPPKSAVPAAPASPKPGPAEGNPPAG